MKHTAWIKTVYAAADGSDRIRLSDTGLHVRDVILDAGLGQQTVIGHLSDLHYNYCNAQDFDEANPAIMSTLQHRRWLAGGASVPIVRRCLSFLEDADQIVVNGDTLDYLSHGAMELMKREIWDRIPHVMATVGGHETTRRMQGLVPDTASWEENLQTVQAFWKHDIYYTSRLVKDRVLIICMFNDRASFYAPQYEKLAADLVLARERDCAVLLFCHEPLATGNPTHSHFTAEDAILVGDASLFPANYGSGRYAGGEGSDAVTQRVYRLITESADVIKGVFAGHIHSDLYLPIRAKRPDGADAVIPQFVNTVTSHEEGHLMRIFVR